MRIVTPDPDANELVRITDLHKSYGSTPVLVGVDLSFRRGEIAAVIGPNGTGKTTLIKCLLGLVRPDRGRIVVDSRPIDEDGLYRRGIGYMPQSASFPENLTGREVIALIRDVRGVASPVDLTLQRRLGLDGELDKPVRALSGGTRQKISAVIAFLFSPGLLVFDEPTAGLDPVAGSALKEHILEAKERGVGVLLTTHVMSDLESLCDRIVFLLDGRVRFDGSLGHLRTETGEQSLERALSILITRDAA